MPKPVTFSGTVAKFSVQRRKGGNIVVGNQASFLGDDLEDAED